MLDTHGRNAWVSARRHCNLKNELTWHCAFKDRNEARLAIFDYIEVFYNRERIHQANGYLSPMAFERSALTPCP
jgi:transposase InsO family protein